MARTAPSADWTESTQAERKAGSGEWDALRTELASLIDQVETRLRTHADQPEEEAGTPDRHSHALRSVRRAMDRQSTRDAEPVDRNRDTGVLTRSEEIAEAIGQIRARQGVKPALPPRGRREPAAERRRPALPETRRSYARADFDDYGYPDADPQALVAMHRTLRDLGARMENFEYRFTSQLADLGSNREVATQVSQLAEVVELLAGAVGDRSPLKRVETQIADLAQAVAHAPETEDAAILERLDALSRVLEDVSGAQGELGARQDAASRYADATMRFVEDSVRGIYEKIDALEAAQAATPRDLEKLTGDLAALTRSLEARDATAQGELSERFSALERRIDSIAISTPDGSGDLRGAVDALRAVVLDSIEPRFVALEDKIDGIGAQVGAAGLIGGGDTDAIALQLRAISDRIDETGSQIEALLQIARASTGPEEGPDFSALADMVAERTRAGLPETTHAANSAPMDRLGETIASVDTRLAQIEATLNAQKGGARPVTRPVVDDTMALSAAPAALSAAPVPVPAFVRADAMPQSPDSDEPLRQRRAAAVSQPIPDPQALVREDAAPVERTDSFRFDPEAIARPEKPTPSFAEDTPFAAAPTAEDDLRTAVNRANFIEAARRAARSNSETEDNQPPRSLIGRAMARFQNSEAQAAPVAEDEKLHAEPAVEPPTVAMADAEIADDAADAPKGESFVKRHRRALLLGTALAVALLLAANLVSQRLLSGPDAAVAPAAPAVVLPEAAPSAPEAAAPVEPVAPIETTEPTVPEAALPETVSPAAAVPAAVRTVPTAPVDEALPAAETADLAFADPTTGALDAAMIDPVTTASIGGAATTPIVAPTAEIEPSMPVAAIPEGIGPEELRAAAADGNMNAQFEIAAILTEGHVVEQDLSQAAAWYERSAAQGFAPAQYRLGNLYESGQGVDADLEQARLWYQRAAEAGNRMSMHNLASLYASGQLETQDFAAAAHWFEEAAARGMTDSQFNLGMLYARGLGVEQSFEDSYVWFSLAAQSGDADASQARDDVARSLDPATLQTLDAQLAAWEPVGIAMTANFAPIGTWSDSFDAGEAITNQEVVLRVQELLGKLGYEIGTPDGVIGPMTRQAIAGFERDTGMSETGVVNPRLLAVLGSQPV